MNTRKTSTILFHVLAWVLLLSIPLLLHKPSRYEHGFLHEQEFIEIPEMISYLCLIALFYFNAYYLVPKFFTRKKIFAYCSMTLLTVLALAMANAQLIHASYPVHRSLFHAFNMRFFSELFIVAISLSYRIIGDNTRLEEVRKEKENENLKTELSFLRSQVSPHFMFNVLNNMVALARKKSDKLEPILIELSGLLRYMLYESVTEKVSLEKEIEYLRSFVNLQMLRFGDDIKVNFNIDNPHGGNFIEPMLFIPLVENAFKHGIGLVRQPEIDIQLRSGDKTVSLKVTNKFNPESKEIKDSSSGIGLSNLRRRLNLLYPAKHQLQITESENEFSVSLNIDLT